VVGRAEVQIYFFHNLVLDGVVVNATPQPGHFAPRKETRYPLSRRVDGPLDRSDRVRKISLSQGFVPGPSRPFRVAITSKMQ